jgi:hypothetical protein
MPDYQKAPQHEGLFACSVVDLPGVEPGLAGDNPTRVAND